jgi:signal transduction histidine kinase
MITTTQDTAAESKLSQPAVSALAIFYIMAAVTLFYLLCAFWPAGQADVNTVAIMRWSLRMSADVRLIWLVIIASSLGSYIHTVTSFTTYAGNRNLVTSWLAWYLLRPAISAALALIFYFTLRAGLFTGASADQTINPFGIASIAGMVGLFSKQATEKLSKIFDTIFS